MKGMVIVHKVAVTTLITLAYSGWLSNSEAMLTPVSYTHLTLPTICSV